MNNLTELKKQYEALGEEIKKLEDSPFVPGWYMYWDNDQEVYRIEYIKTVCVYNGASWDNTIPVTQELLNKFLPKKETLYDWSVAPDWAKWAATDKNGDAHWFGDTPDIIETYQEWIADWGQIFYRGNNNYSDWRNSLEERPHD